MHVFEYVHEKLSRIMRISTQPRFACQLHDTRWQKLISPPASQELMLWMTPSEAPKALQASECRELLDPMRASCWISAQHWPGKFTLDVAGTNVFDYIKFICLCLTVITTCNKYTND